jgi:hypothetical protein
MIGHSWGKDNEYQRFVDLISQFLVQGSEWINLSIPRDGRIKTAGGLAADKRAILARMKHAECFVGLAHIDVSHREFCQSEWDFSLALDIPSVGVRPHEAQKVSRYAMEHATLPDVPWRALDVCVAICRVTGRADLANRVQLRHRRSMANALVSRKARPSVAVQLLLRGDRN